MSAQDGLFSDKKLEEFTQEIIKSQRQVTGILDEIQPHELYPKNRLEQSELQRILTDWQSTPAATFASDVIDALEKSLKPNYQRIREIVKGLSESEQRMIVDAFMKIRLTGKVSFEESDKIIDDEDVIQAQGVFRSKSGHEIYIATTEENQ